MCLIPKNTRSTAAPTLLATLKAYPTDAQQGINCKEPLAWFQLVVAWRAGCRLVLVTVPLDFDNPPAAVRAELGATFSDFVGVFFAVIVARWLRLLPRKPRQKTEEVAQPQALARAHAPWATETRAAAVRAELGATFSKFVGTLNSRNVL